MDQFEIDEINASRGLSGVHWQQTPLMGLVGKHPIGWQPFSNMVAKLTT